MLSSWERVTFPTCPKAPYNKSLGHYVIICLYWVDIGTLCDYLSILGEYWDIMWLFVYHGWIFVHYVIICLSCVDIGTPWLDIGTCDYLCILCGYWDTVIICLLGGYWDAMWLFVYPWWILGHYVIICLSWMDIGSFHTSRASL